jgi:hypothetical protein
MQMTGWRSYWKMALLAGIAGAVLVGAGSFAIPDRYVCMAAMVLVNSPSVKEGSVKTNGELALTLQQLELEVLSRDNLVALIQDPRLDLYRTERTHLPVEEVAEEMGRKRIKVVPLGMPGGGDVQAFRIWFEYPDKCKARAVVSQLVQTFRLKNVIRQGIGVPDAPRLSLLEAPITPETPIFPNRRAIAFMGALAGMTMGFVFAVWRRTRYYAVVTLAIPKETRAFVDSQIAGGQYPSVSEYVRVLIRADEQRHK